MNWQTLLDGEWGYCFGCGQNNPIGLKLRFTWDGTVARAEYTPKQDYQGWPGVVHGGIIANMLDEGAGWAMVFNGMYGVTAKMEVLFHNPAPVDTPLIITGKITRIRGKRIETKSLITNIDGTLIAEGNILLISMRNGHLKPTGVLDFNVIWDMDGVIVDTREYHFESWHYTFQQHGINFTENDFQQRFGQRNDAIIHSVLKGKVTPENISEIANNKETYFRKIVKDNIKPQPGAVELIKSLAKHGIKMALASSAPPENIELIIGNLGLRDCFQVIIPGEEVEESKPSPQLFLRAAEKLGVKPRDCIVFEDAIAGVEAAKRGGMYCIGVTATNTKDKLHKADLVVDSLEEISIHSLEMLLNKDINNFKGAKWKKHSS